MVFENNVIISLLFENNILTFAITLNNDVSLCVYLFLSSTYLLSNRLPNYLYVNVNDVRELDPGRKKIWVQLMFKLYTKEYIRLWLCAPIEKTMIGLCLLIELTLLSLILCLY